MNLTTISEISKNFDISTRTLRYYEKIGLLQSSKKEGYAYRTYDEEAITRLQQIIILRKLRIPLKQIIEILDSKNTLEIIETFKHNLDEVDEEITALSTIKRILCTFIDRLRENTLLNIKIDLFDDDSILDIVDSLTVSRKLLKENKDLADLNKADQKLKKLTDRDVRIIYLAPSSVASYQYVGDDPEMHVNQVIDKFVRDNDLVSMKPDMRHYGFNSPNPDATGFHGYEVWVTIPDDTEVPKPLVKKHFEGGLYAVHTILFGEFEGWGLISTWVEESSKYDPVYNWTKGNEGVECMFGCLEEHLNYINHVNLENTEPDGTQFDLLIPVKEKESI